MPSAPHPASVARVQLARQGRKRPLPKNDAQPVCFECVGEEYVSSHIETVGTLQLCAFCGNSRKSITLEDLANLVNDALAWNFTEADEEPVIDPNSDKVYYELGGELLRFAIAETLLIDEPLTKALLKELATSQDPAFDYDDNELHIETIEPSAYHYSGDWTEFAETIKHHKRYFDEEAVQRLETILLGADRFVSPEGHTALRTISPGDVDALFYRARHANSESTRLAMCLAPQKELGPPPPQAAVAGRMNPAGISVFYGSFEPLTCISEIRVPVGGLAAIASFTILRPIRVLDLTAFDEGPEHISYFDRNRLEILGHMLFLAEFHREMRRPVLPQDEAIDYIPTQVVSDFLAHRFTPQLDGLIYSSSLTTPAGRNIVLFSHAAGLPLAGANELAPEPIPRLVGALTDYAYIIEQRAENEPPILAAAFPSRDNHPLIDLTRPPTSPAPPPTLAYVEGSLQFNRVTSIAVAVDSIRILRAPPRPDTERAA